VQPLEGIAFASPAVNLPGPLATSRLPEFGASVTKVVSPAGDPPAHAAKERRLVQMETACARP
jgi:alpha-methylacyl-CoA racemase